MTRITTIERRRLLFDEFSSLLASISPDHLGHYACPICLRLFTKADVEIEPDTTDSLLTLEDVVPKRLGKKLYVLTCKDCNNNVGGKALDVHFHKQIEFAEFFATTGKTITVNMLIGGHRLHVEWSRHANGASISNDLRVLADSTDPAAVEATKKLLSEGLLDTLPEILLRFVMPSDRRARISQLKIGYLAAFSKLHYKYILDKKLDVIRQQIQNPEQDLVPIDAMVVSIVKPTSDNVLVVLEPPADLDGLAVVFKLKKTLNGSNHRGVILPSPFSDPTFFDQLITLKNANRTPRLHGRTISL